MKLIWKGLALIVVFYVVAVAIMYTVQRRFVYVPDTTRTTPSVLGLRDIEEVELETPDGEMLVTWRLAAKAGNPTVLYFHGNAGNLASRAERAKAYGEAGYGVMMLSYRGYGGSTGDPSEEKIAADAQLAFDSLRGDGVPGEKIILYGESIGTGVATRLAANNTVGALVLDAPFTSLVDVAAREQPVLPVHALLTDRYELVSQIKSVKAPILVLHGELDPLIPVDMGKAVFAAANEPKMLKLFPNGHHSDLYEHGAMAVIRDFVETHMSQ